MVEDGTAHIMTGILGCVVTSARAARKGTIIMTNEKTINALIARELKEANKKHGCSFVDNNHALGVLYEELDEANVEMGCLSRDFEKFVAAVKCNLPIVAAANDIYKDCMLAIGELIQVAAMAQKSVCSEEKRGKDKLYSE